MSPQQKYFAFNLVVAVLAILCYFALLPFIGPWRATGSFGLLGLCGVSALLLSREQWKGRLVNDEREQQIWQRATLIAKSAVWVGLVAAFLLALMTVGDKGLISIQSLALAIWWAFSIFLLVQSAVALFLAAR
jgi:hypothetical protein